MWEIFSRERKRKKEKNYLRITERKLKERPVGTGVHLTGDQEMGMEAEGDRGRVRNAEPLRHMLERGCLGEKKTDEKLWLKKTKGQENL